MRLSGISPSRWVVVLAVCTAMGSAAELSLRPVPGVLLTPLAVAAWTLFLAVLLHLRNRRSEQLHQRALAQASELQLATIEALALAIDARAQTSASQLRRHRKLAGALAEALGLPPEEIEGVRTAALLHDVGRLAVPDQILGKQEPLTEEERSKIRMHVEVGAEIIANVPFPYPVASLVRSHHERWDGTGYPSGLKGDEIPLGARILTVVERFVDLTSDRAAKRGGSGEPGADEIVIDFTSDRAVGRAGSGELSADEAVVALRAEAGLALDPAVVERFVESLPSIDGVPAAGDYEAAAEAAPPHAVEVAGSARDQNAALADIAMASKELHTLYEVAEAVGSTIGVTDSMEALASTLRALIPFSACALFLRDEGDGILRCRFANGIGDAAIQSLLFGEGMVIAGRAIAGRASVMGDPPLPGTTAPGIGDGELRAALATPLVVRDEIIGALVLFHESREECTDDHRRLAAHVSEQIAAVIGNSLAFERAQQESVTDALTGLPNTRFLAPHMEREIARARRLGSPMAALLLDLDRMKQINDTYGHATGDRALRAVAAALRGGIRPYDVCVRYGGDEFILLLSDCGREQAEAKRLELKRAVAALVFEDVGGPPLTLSISVGAAVFPDDGEGRDELLRVADSRMYRDKAKRSAG